MANNPKGQHHVPILMLRRFVDGGGRVWTYDKKQVDRPRDSLPDETAKETHLYTIFDDKGQPNFAIEETLSRIESTAEKHYEELLSGGIPSGAARMEFAQFVATLFARAPALRRTYGQMMGVGVQLTADTLTATKERFARSIAQWSREEKITKPVDVDELYEFFKDKSRYTLTVDREATLQAIGIADKLTELFYDMSWAVVATTDEHPFITSDFPVVKFSDPKTHHPLLGDGGFENRTAVISVPLSPTRLLRLTWQDRDAPRLIVADANTVKIFNRVRAYHAERFLYAHRRAEGIRRLCEKYKNNRLETAYNGSIDYSRIEVVRNFRKPPTGETLAGKKP